MTPSTNDYVTELLRDLRHCDFNTDLAYPYMRWPDHERRFEIEADVIDGEDDFPESIDIEYSYNDPGVVWIVVTWTRHDLRRVGDVWHVTYRAR